MTTTNEDMNANSGQSPQISELIQMIDQARKMALDIKDVNARTAAYNLGYVIKRLNGTAPDPAEKLNKIKSRHRTQNAYDSDPRTDSSKF